MPKVWSWLLHLHASGSLLHSMMEAHLLGQILSWEHQQSPGAALLMSAAAALIREPDWHKNPAPLQGKPGLSPRPGWGPSTQAAGTHPAGAAACRGLALTRATRAPHEAMRGTQ